MQWISVDNGLPETPGKYIVKTRTMMGNTLRLDATMCMTHYGKKTWAVSNQVVTHWLKE